MGFHAPYPEEQAGLDDPFVVSEEANKDKKGKGSSSRNKPLSAKSSSSDKPSDKSSNRSPSNFPMRSIAVDLPKMELKQVEFCICPCDTSKGICYKPTSKGSNKCHGCQHHYG